MATKKTETERYLEQKIRELKEGEKLVRAEAKSERLSLAAFLRRGDFDSFLNELAPVIETHATLREYESEIGDLEEDLHNFRATRT